MIGRDVRTHTLCVRGALLWIEEGNRIGVFHCILNSENSFPCFLLNYIGKGSL
ncbi:hypothetical protein HBI81_047530 [Parastagonospora nodorum]|nr:hypothetical protein HBH51_150270 [Parastagonospora nodorum]KAH5072220.1 hypothetical protein HBH95_171050 [Parastagonospora nodorum]KAH5124078.1 hypothetical protein HBH71_033020 [Parastagonospora nodorum]KAH5168050.1 hypothetical protein HBH68_231150 [Parastagonospora nodorum]KAH5271794.1 hypothetical protein HBI71_047910 [Parastagonospora nodorum]